MAVEEKVNILVVDDLPEKLLAIELILQDLGQNLVQARSGREALRRLLERDFALILLDVNMPDMDGFETAQLIRQRQRTEHTPIIFVTAFTDEMHAARGYSLGAVDYILSPVIPDVLRTKVSVFVDLYRKSEQVRRQAEERVSLAREQAARAAAEEATRRSLFLAEASAALVRSLDYETTLRGLAAQVVPFLADLGAVTVADEDGLWKTEFAWQEGGGLRQWNAAGDPGLADPLTAAIRRVLAGGREEALAAIAAEPGAASDSGPGGPWASALVLPLKPRGRTLGALTLALGPSGRRFTPADAGLAEDLAGRAAVALDNARLYRDIQERERHKNEFLAMLAHELRNPLAPISNAVRVLRSTVPPGGEQAWPLEVIERQAKQLVRLVDDLLDVSRITRGKIELQREAVDLRQVVSVAVETSRPLVEARRHELSIEVPDEPLLVEGDPTRLAQVLSNLLNNAAKYTEEGGSVRVAAGREGDRVALRVRDNGIGIAPAMLGRIFELFAQAERALDRSQGGLGIGLTLVRRLTEMHGGEVTAHSAGLGQGSEFVVRLPALAGPAPAVNGHQEPAAAAPPRRVLVVDDNHDAAESLAMFLRMLGQEVRTAPDGPAALEAVAEFVPEVVLLDIGLPRMDGYEVARRLRCRPGGERLLIVALSGYGQPDDRRRSREAGFDHHFVKPIDPGDLDDLLAAARPVPRGPALHT